MIPIFKVFVSYAHVNNSSKWVSQFARHLREKLPGEMRFPAKVQVWLDEIHLSANEPFPDDIRDAVCSSDVYLAVVSHGYFNSSWCRQEREAFLARWKESVKGRLFVIHHSPVALDDPAWPEELKELTGFTFYHQEHDTGFAITLGEDQERPDHAYFVLVRKVAWAIAQKFDQIDQAQRLKEKATPFPVIPATPLLAPCVNLLVVAPKDMGPEAQALRKRI